jgi:hypothetical protein
VMDEEKATENIKKFMEQYGIRGFLVLYFSKYLFRTLIFQLKSKISDINPKRDPAYIFFTKNGEIMKHSDINKYEDELYEICKQKAEIIVEKLEKNDDFLPLFKGDFSEIKDTILEKEFETSLHQIFENLKEDR